MKRIMVAWFLATACGSDEADDSANSGSASMGTAGGQCDPVPPSCCAEDADCATADERCYFATCEMNGVAGVCRPIPDTAGECWDSRDCGPNENCVGAQACCECFAQEVMGTCELV